MTTAGINLVRRTAKQRAATQNHETRRLIDLGVTQDAFSLIVMHILDYDHLLANYFCWGSRVQPGLRPMGTPISFPFLVVFYFSSSALK